MAALHVPATIGYDPALFGLSVVVAVGVSTCTLWLAARLRRERAGRAALERLLFAAAMGGGLTLMHLVAVRAGRFIPDAVWREEFRGASAHALPQAWLAPWVAAATVVAAAGLAVAASASRWREDRHGRRAAGDRLTGLPNGTLLVEQLRATLAHGDPCAVISVRGERLGPLRHRLGPRAGERLLVRVGWRLVAAAGPAALAARMEGAEYAVLVPDARAADAVVARIRERLTVPFSSDDVLVLLPVAVGVAVARPGDTPHGLLARAARAAELAHRRPLAPVAGPA
jgi:GGDEF domain-containing protein